MSVLFGYLKQAEFGRTQPKNKIYEHSGGNSCLKHLFVEQVEKIVWRYKLAPETINLGAQLGAAEVRVFAIQLKSSELHRDVLRCIDGAVQFPILYALTHVQGAEAKLQVVAAYKRLSEADAASWAGSDYFESGCTSATTERTSLPQAIDLGGHYELLLRRLVPVAARPNGSLGIQVIRPEQIKAKEREGSSAPY